MSFREFIKVETASGIVLLVAALLALIVANSPGQHFYSLILNYPLALRINALALNLTGDQIINNGLMTIFFLLVSLEIKRELLSGELNSRAKALLPVIAAAGGMLIPALIYIVFNYHDPNALQGWAIPVATDIAFSLAVLRLLGSRIPSALKTFLMALAIIDDLGAIIIIAVFYTAHISLFFLALAFCCLIILILLNYFNISRFLPYGIIGILLWLCIMESGVHATIAGVILGFVAPQKKLEHTLHPWVAYGILPLFAFANAGLVFSNINTAALLNPLTLGTAAGLFFGKPIGVFGASWLAIKNKIAALPKNIDWQQLFGVSLLCGIGFTMSLFIGNLSPADNNLVRLGVLGGSVLSALAGYWVLKKQI
jgi:Na+:H+ antiporter, NhaA family